MKMERKHGFLTKGLALLLAVVMTAALVPAFVSLAETPAYEEEPASLTYANGNLARGEKVEIISQYDSHYDPSWNWENINLNDGKMNTVENDEGTSTGGFHTSTVAVNEYGQNLFTNNHGEWVGYNFGETVEFDTVVVYPSMDSDGVCRGMPNAFAIEVSVDGENYKRVYEAYDYAIPAFGPQTFQFDAVSVQYVRFVALSLNQDRDFKWALKLSEMAVYNEGYANTEPYCPNLAAGKPVTSTDCHFSEPTWNRLNINDGDRYNLVTTQYDWGQFAGWHTSTQAAADEAAWIVIDLEEKTAVDRVVIWPSTERFRNTGASPAGADNLALPLTMKIEVSDDGETFTEVASLSEMPTKWEPIQIDFTRTETQYVRLYMTRNGHVKLSEFEIFDTTKSVTPEKPGEEEALVKPGVNLAPGGKVFYSSIINSDGWDLSNLNNETVEEAGGFTTAAGTDGSVLYCGIEFAQLTRVNKVVLYSAATSAIEDEGIWSGIPRSLKIQYSVDELTWYDVAEKTFEDPVPGQDAVEILFDAVDAKYIRVWTDDPWLKASDGGRTYIQLAEMEVWYDPFTLGSEDAFAVYYQEQEGSGSTHALRVLLVANESKLPSVEYVTVKIVFTLTDGKTKSLTKILGGENSDYELYRKVTAGDDVYTAAAGCAIFGSVITDIPDGAYTGVTVTITETDTSNVLLSVSRK